MKKVEGGGSFSNHEFRKKLELAFPKLCLITDGNIAIMGPVSYCYSYHGIKYFCILWTKCFYI